MKLISYCSDAASKPSPAGLPRRLGQSSRANSCTKLGPAGLSPRLRQLKCANSRTRLGPAGLPPRLRQSSHANSSMKLGAAGLPPRLSKVPDLAFLLGAVPRISTVKVREIRDSFCNCAPVTAISAQQQALRLRHVPCGSDIPPVKARRFGDYS